MKVHMIRHAFIILGCLGLPGTMHPRKIMLFILLWLGVPGFDIPGLAPFKVRAQACPAWPADCPDKDYVNADPAEDSSVRMNNPLVPQEITMEYRLREITGRLMHQVVGQEHWTEPVELTEGGSSGFRNPDGSVVAYPLRPPHSFGIVWQVIVNPDSLQLWADWLKDFSERRLAGSSESLNRIAAKQDVIKADMDSANYYGDLKAQYMTAHSQQYQQAILSGDKRASGAFEKVLAGYDSKMNGFVNRAAGEQKDASGEKAEAGFEREKKVRGLTFRESVVLLVEFDFNADDAFPEDMVSPGAGVSSPGISLVRWYVTPEPDLQDPIRSYKHSRNTALALIGPWNLKADIHGRYVADFKADKKNTDRVSPKRIKCDQVQCSNIFCSGNKNAIRKFLADLAAVGTSDLLMH